MEVIELLDDDVVYNLYDLSTLYSEGDSVTIYNNANNELFISRQITQPNLKFGTPIKQGEEKQVTGKTATPIWVSGAQGSVVVQRTVDNITVSSTVDLPADVWTSKNPRTRRLQVDVGEASFEEGREFYCLASGTLTGGASSPYKFIFNTDIIIESTKFDVFSGDVKLRIWRGGSDNGNITVPVPILPANSMSEVESLGYTTQTLKYGPAVGAVYNNDGEEIDYFRVKTDSNSNKSVISGGNAIEQLGLQAGTYYFVFENQDLNAGAEVAIKERWQERPSQFI